MKPTWGNSLFKIGQFCRIGLLIGLLVLSSMPLYAWDLQLGVKKSRPSLGAGEQTYTSDSSSLVFKPSPTGSTTSDNRFLGVQVDEWAGGYETSEWNYPTEIWIAGATEAQTLEMQMKETRVGLNYEMARDLAGFFVGGGFSTFEESFTLSDVIYSHKTTVPYARWGFDLIFGALRVRADQIQQQVGPHYLKVNGIGLLLVF